MGPLTLILPRIASPRQLSIFIYPRLKPGVSTQLSDLRPESLGIATCRLLLKLIFTDLYAADLTGDGLGKLVDKLYDAWIFVRGSHSLHMVLDVLD